MSVVTGLGLGLLVVVLGAGALTVLALYLRKRDAGRHNADRLHHA